MKYTKFMEYIEVCRLELNFHVFHAMEAEYKGVHIRNKYSEFTHIVYKGVAVFY